MLRAQKKSEFSKRLWKALEQSPTPVKGPTQLACAFNLQHRAGPGISVQTAHKWLAGRAIPTDEKIETLAKWLNVTAHWLHYGPPPETKSSKSKSVKGEKASYSLSQETLLLAQKIETLPDRQRGLVAELITQIYEKLPE